METKVNSFPIVNLKIHPHFSKQVAKWQTLDWWQINNDMICYELSIDFLNDRIKQAKSQKRIDSINDRIIKKLKQFKTQSYIHPDARGIPKL